VEKTSDNKKTRYDEGKLSKKTRKEIAPERRDQLVNATVSVIDEVGLANATLGQIADRIGISAGLIPHYFGDKKGLIYATMRKLMADVKALHDELQKDIDKNDPIAQIKVIIDANFHVQQDNQSLIKTWLNFWLASLYDTELYRLQKVNEHILYSSLYSHFAKIIDRTKARDAARGLAAMIDGLWLHLALSADFSLADGRRIVYHYLDQFLAKRD